MHISPDFRANLAKGGDAKPPVYGTLKAAMTWECRFWGESNPKIAGLPSVRAHGPGQSFLFPDSLPGFQHLSAFRSFRRLVGPTELRIENVT